MYTGKKRKKNLINFVRRTKRRKPPRVRKRTGGLGGQNWRQSKEKRK